MEEFGSEFELYGYSNIEVVDVEEPAGNDTNDEVLKVQR